MLLATQQVIGPGFVIRQLKLAIGHTILVHVGDSRHGVWGQVLNHNTYHEFCRSGDWRLRDTD